MRPCHRLFFALKPTEIEARLTGLVRDSIEPGLDPVRNDRLHMTLGITDDFAAFPNDIAERMQAIGDSASSDSFALSLDRLSGGTRSVALRPNKRLPALTALQHQLDSQLRYWGLMRRDWAFNPHVTLGYREALSFLRPITPLEWQVQDLVLIHSLVGATQHSILGRWKLMRRQFDLFSV